ncbi:MAG: MBL fold metallo-hydrolase [Oscillospiraceae bacterium]|nr:MBL fold metallo-hydrolase [Oscillospiraceae bacterium]
MALKFKVFLHSYLGFNSNSTLIYGENDAILIDASQLMSDSYKMISEIIPMRKRLTHIYVSHFHPDHHFGLKALHFAFPEARIVGLPQTVHDIVDITNDKLDMWAIERFGDDFPYTTTIPMIMKEPRLELEGEEILVFGGYEGDSINNSIVWAPSIRLLCATDIAFHDCHLWPIESNVERRAKWRKDIARMMEFDPRVIIPGHCDEAKLELLEDVAHDEARSYTDCVDWSIKYLDFYDEVYHSAKTGKDMVDMMFKRYDLKAEDFAIHWQTRLIFPRSSPEWLTPLPGRRGEIFLNPHGVYDGDPAREE